MSAGQSGAVVGLSDQDRTFLERKRKNLKGTLVVAWALFLFPLLVGIVVAANAGQVVDWLDEIRGPVDTRLAAEGTQLDSLETTTSLEKELVDQIKEKNKLLAALFKVLLWSSVALVGFILISGCFSHGITLLVMTRADKRYLRIISALEEYIRLRHG